MKHFNFSLASLKVFEKSIENVFANAGKNYNVINHFITVSVLFLQVVLVIDSSWPRKIYFKRICLQLKMSVSWRI